MVNLIELRSYFDLSREEMDTVERGAKDPELQPLIDAASRIAYAEDTAIFHGYSAGGIQGIDQASSHPTLPIPDDYQEYPHSIAEATRLLRLAGVDGPYAIALGPRYYTGLTQATGDGGYPVLNVVRKLVDGPLVWAPAVNGAVVLSIRGGDFELDDRARPLDRLPRPQREIDPPVRGREHGVPRAHSRGGGGPRPQRGKEQEVDLS